MTDIQTESDRKAAEHARLVDTPLPDGWLQICMDAGFPGLPADMSVEEAHRRIRAIVNAVIPLYEQQLRAQVAAELDRRAYKAADCDVDGPYCREAVTWTAAARIARGDHD